MTIRVLKKSLSVLGVFAVLSGPSWSQETLKVNCDRAVFFYSRNSAGNGDWRLLNATPSYSVVLPRPQEPLETSL